MTRKPINPLPVDDKTNWRKDRKLVRKGFKDLEYLPPGRAGWNATLAASAYAVRRQVAGRADLSLWAAMHGCPPSARYEQLGDDGLVLWHGTSSGRAERIREFGLFHKRGVWAALDPRIAHGFARSRSTDFEAHSAMVVLLVSKNEWQDKADCETPNVVRFHASVPPECVEYVLCDDRIEFLGKRKADHPKPWGVARFKRREGRWAPRSRPPVRFDEEHTYSGLAGWLEQSIRRILNALGPAAAIELFSSLYATMDPWDALEHAQVFAALEELCGQPRQARGGIRQFSLASE